MGNPEVDAAVKRFLEENPVDDRASEMLRTQRPDVQESVMEEGDLLHCANPSATLIKRVTDTARKSKAYGGHVDPSQVANLFWWKSYDSTGVAIGRVKLKRQGFSLLSSTEALGKDVYAHEKTVHPDLLGPADILAFKSHDEPEWDGPEADKPVWKLFGPLSGPSSFGMFTGHINRVLENGSGFVNCPEAGLDGHKPFIHKTVMAQCNLQRGDVISFHVHVNQQGQPQVSTPVWKCI